MDTLEHAFIDNESLSLPPDLGSHTPLRPAACGLGIGRQNDGYRASSDEGEDGVTREDTTMISSAEGDGVRRKERAGTELVALKTPLCGLGDDRAKEHVCEGTYEREQIDDESIEHDGKQRLHMSPALTSEENLEKYHISPNTGDDDHNRDSHRPEAMETQLHPREEDTSSCNGQSTSDDDDSSSDVSSTSTRAAHMLPDPEDGFDLVRTLRHYRRRRHRSSDSNTTNSNCSCDSCVSRTNLSYFGSEEGPPGGEATVYRRAAVWLESIKYLWGLLIYGLLAVTTMLTGAATWAWTRDHASDQEVGRRMLQWTLPLLVLVVVVIIVWRGTWYVLLRRGYGKGDQIVDRSSIIKGAQRKKLVYTVRGAIYAPTKPNPKGKNEPPLYEVVAYESEYDSSTYFDSDLEEDGQYRRDITPWREVADPVTQAKRNIYTRKSWFRDVPIVWWEVCTEPPRDF